MTDEITKARGYGWMGRDGILRATCTTREEAMRGKGGAFWDATFPAQAPHVLIALLPAEAPGSGSVSLADLKRIDGLVATVSQDETLCDSEDFAAWERIRASLDPFPAGRPPVGDIPRRLRTLAGAIAGGTVPTGLERIAPETMRAAAEALEAAWAPIAAPLGYLTMDIHGELGEVEDLATAKASAARLNHTWAQDAPHKVCAVFDVDADGRLSRTTAGPIAQEPSAARIVRDVLGAVEGTVRKAMPDDPDQDQIYQQELGFLWGLGSANGIVASIGWEGPYVLTLDDGEDGELQVWEIRRGGVYVCAFHRESTARAALAALQSTEAVRSPRSVFSVQDLWRVRDWSEAARAQMPDEWSPEDQELAERVRASMGAEATPDMAQESVDQEPTRIEAPLEGMESGSNAEQLAQAYADGEAAAVDLMNGQADREVLRLRAENASLRKALECRCVDVSLIHRVTDSVFKLWMDVPDGCGEEAYEELCRGICALYGAVERDAPGMEQEPNALAVIREALEREHDALAAASSTDFPRIEGRIEMLKELATERGMMVEDKSVGQAGDDNG